MTKPRPPLDPDCVDEAPRADTLTSYDKEHLVTYLRLLDAEGDDADWTVVARVLQIRRENLHALAARGRLTSPAPNG